MDQHPIPKNVLTVEFKLFGALSVRQFLRVLVGCLIALALYALPVHPIIKYPGIIISILVGAGSALLPGFDVRLSGLLKSVFVSPRYVWKKNVNVPEVLSDLAKPANNTKDSSRKATKSGPVDQDDLSIEQILATRSQVVPLIQSPQPNTNLAVPAVASANDVDQDDRFAKLYAEEFGLTTIEDTMNRRATQQPVAPVSGLASSIPAVSQVQIGPNMQASLTPVNNMGVRKPARPLVPPLQAVQKDTANLLTTYREELSLLQSQLQQLNRQGGDEARKQKILARINEIYADVQPVAKDSNHKQPASLEAQENNKLLYGIVLDKQNNPIQGAVVEVNTLQAKKLIGNLITRADGTFAVDLPLSAGEYIVKIAHPNYKFGDYKIIINNQKLPGFKFKAR